MLKIKEVREQKGISQDSVVATTGIPKRSYVNYENGQTDVPISKLQNIASALGVSVSVLIGENLISNVAMESSDSYNPHDLNAVHLDLKKDIRSLNDNILALEQGVTRNFESIGNSLIQLMKNDLKIIRELEKVNTKKILNTASKLEEFLEKQNNA